MVDVTTETVIERPIEAVAAYVSDPDNAPEWYVNIKSIRWETSKAVQVGLRVAFVARFLGRELAYTYEIVEYVPERRMVMRTAHGPFPMETTYMWESLGPVRTKMTLRNAGQPSGFSKVLAPVLAAQMKRANEKDLARLKRILESRGETRTTG